METQTFFKLTDAPKAIQRINGTRPSVSTIFRWRAKGVKGVRLRTVRHGAARMTTEAWIREFFDRLSEIDEAELSDAIERQRPADAGATAAKLDAMGIKSTPLRCA